jgi:alkylated DNA nucleotide flippase Atl1
MIVANLFTKGVRSEPMVKRASIDLISGVGISGDANADALSPRQLLVVSGPVLESLGIAAGDIRENVVVDGVVDSLLSGQVLQLGEAVVRLTYRCEPCFRLEEVRKGLARQLLGRRGFLARVLVGGKVRAGDNLELLPQRLRPIPDDPKARLADLLTLIPAGTVVTFRQMRVVLGYASSYLRVLPFLLRNMCEDLPAHRVIATDLRLIDRHLPRQREMLMAEGVHVDGANAVSVDCLWDTRAYFGDESASQVFVDTRPRHRTVLARSPTP